ncbi:acyltransferase [Sphingomonas sp. IW22]|uniref:acyltransferase family protein n=1 Tax=Sphingomonas sp. IW22 TaxID=3242489 RepID=UPI0035209B63
MNRPTRYDDLELLRGLAAVAVVIYHFLRAFLPPSQMPLFADVMGIAVERPFVLALVNGPFMVTIFFVLSSFALTVRLVEARVTVPTLVAMTKRFPRLFPMTFVGAMLPALLFAAGWMMNVEASALNGSSWLANSGGVKISNNWPDPSIVGGAADSIRLFAQGLSQYNSVLWTMRYELLGSLIALSTALVIAGERRPLFDVAATGLIALLALPLHSLCSICAVTVLLTKYLRGSPIRFPPHVAATLILLGLAIGSTYKPFPEEMATDPQIGVHVLRMDWLIHGVGAVLVFLGVHRWRREQAPDWPRARKLGQLSFAIYVLHVPVIGSLASAVVLAMGYNLIGVGLAALATLLATGLMALWLSRLDLWWVGMLNRVARKVAVGQTGPGGLRPQSTDAP